MGDWAQLDAEMESLLGPAACPKITYRQLYGKCEKYLILGLVLQMLTGPGVSLLLYWLQVTNPCINRFNQSYDNSITLFWVVAGLFIFLWLVCLIRSGLYMHGVSFCNSDLAYNHILLHVAFYSTMGLVLSAYCIYIWSLNVFAMVGVLINMLLLLALYIPLFLEHHTRTCPGDHQVSMVNYPQHHPLIRGLEFVAFVVWIAFLCCIYVYDDSLNTQFRLTLMHQGRCLGSEGVGTVRYYEFLSFAITAGVQLIISYVILLYLLMRPVCKSSVKTRPAASLRKIVPTSSSVPVDMEHGTTVKAGSSLKQFTSQRPGKIRLRAHLPDF